MKYLLILVSLLSACQPNGLAKSKIIMLLNSKNHKNDILKGAYYAGEHKDTSFICPLLLNAYNPQISHDKNFYGMSVHRGVIIALSKITGKFPPSGFTNEVDTLNIKFYRDYLKNINCTPTLK